MLRRNDRFQARGARNRPPARLRKAWGREIPHPGRRRRGRRFGFRSPKEGSQHVSWSLRDAQNHLSEVIRQARAQGPQAVTVRGQRAAVVVSAADYDALRGRRPTLVDHLLAGPPWDEELAQAVSDRSRGTRD